MRRMVSVWFPSLSTDRLRGTAASPLVIAARDGQRRVVAAADAAACAGGVRAGMTVSQAQAMLPDLTVLPADTAEDAALLAGRAARCLDFSPLCRPDPPDGLLVDITGCAHLQGGEAALLGRLLAVLAEGGISVRGALADTPGAAWAVARFGAAPSVVPPGQAAAALENLPPAALRLPAAMLPVLHRLGFERIGRLLAAPRAPLARRFGPALMRRLDQAIGLVAEPIDPVFPPETIQHRLAFPEPILMAEAFAAVIPRLVRAVCDRLEREGQGARRVALLLERVDGSVQAIVAGTARPSRDPAHLSKLLDMRVERIDPGLGVEAMRLVVPRAETLAWRQGTALAEEADAAAVAMLIDRLESRLGAGKVWRAVPVESQVPERCVARVAPLARDGGGTWPSRPRPVRLLDPPQPVEAMAVLPDHPPAAFTWRRVRHRVRRADGPERVHGEWWRREGERGAVRDYYRVEDEAGRRFWLFRRGDGANPESGDRRWFLHGLF